MASEKSHGPHARLALECMAQVQRQTWVPLEWRRSRPGFAPWSAPPPQLWERDPLNQSSQAVVHARRKLAFHAVRKLAFHAESNYFYFYFHAVGKVCLVLQAVALPTETHGIVQWEFEDAIPPPHHQFSTRAQEDVRSGGVEDYPVTFVNHR